APRAGRGEALGVFPPPGAPGGRGGPPLPISRGEGRQAGGGVLPRPSPAEPFLFADIGEPPVPSLNRGFSAPIKLIANLGADDLRFLAAHDADPFNRWQALQTLATRLLVDNTAALRANGAVRQDSGLLDALGAILADGALEPAFVALAL